jgi:hypothetical protein
LGNTRKLEKERKKIQAQSGKKEREKEKKKTQIPPAKLGRSGTWLSDLIIPKA